MNRVYFFGRFLVVVWLLFCGAVLADSNATSGGYHPVELLQFRGIPRLGVQDSHGLVDSSNPNTTQKHMKSNPALALATGEKIEKHNYTLGLLVRLDFMRQHPECFANMQTYEARVEQCEGTYISHGNQLGFWRSYIENMSLSMMPETRSQAFCFGQVECIIRSIDQVIKLTDPTKPGSKANPPLRLNEFETRRLINQRFETLVNQYMPGFDSYWKTKRFPEFAYLVFEPRLGEYDFNKKRFSFPLGHSSYLYSRNNYPWNAGATQKTVTPMHSLVSRNIVPEFHYTPTLPFEQGFGGHGSGNTSFMVHVPMQPADAQKLVENGDVGRTVYAVVKVKFLPRPLKQSLLSGQMTAIPYHYAENHLELFTDEALQHKFAELPLADEPAPVETNSGQTKYTPVAGTTLFDSRALSLLRADLGDIPTDVLDRAVTGIVASEAALWKEHEKRQSLTQISGLSEDVQKLNKDRAQLSHYSWQQRDQLGTAQQQDLRRYLLGFGELQEQQQPIWPDSLPAVAWGMNLATVFDKDAVNLDPLSGNKVDANSRQQAATFLNEIAAVRDITHLTAVYALNDVRYDEKTGQLTYQVRYGPFQKSLDLITFTEQGTDVYKSAAPNLVHESARQKVINRLATSDSALTELPQASPGGCATHEVRHSTDCRVGYTAFFPFQFYATFMALDRQIKLPAVSLSAVQGRMLANKIRKSGWRVVVEFSHPSLALVPFDYKKSGKKDINQGETYTLSGNVERVLILDPDENIVWSQQGSDMPAAKQATQMINETEQPETYQFPAVIEPGPKLYDFLLAKYYPQHIDQKMLEGMISSRWSYEQAEKQPLGGRFFSESSRTPNYSEVQKMTGDFKQWLMATAESLPEEMTVRLDLLYSQNNLNVTGTCFTPRLPKDAPVRNNTTAMAQAQGEVRKCENANAQMLRQYDQCQTLRGELQEKQVERKRAGDNNCLAEKNNAATDSVQQVDRAGDDGPCHFPRDMTATTMSQELKSCMADVCGQPTAANLTEFQACVGQVQQQAQRHIKEMMGVPDRNNNVASSPVVADTCKALDRDIRNLNNRIKQQRCNSLVEKPEPQNCALLGVVEQPDAMPIERLEFPSASACDPWGSFDRRRRSSAALLPNGTPHPGTAVDMVVYLNQLQLPYEPPAVATEFQVLSKAAAVVKLKIIGLNNPQDKKKVMTLQADVLKVEYLSP